MINGERFGFAVSRRGFLAASGALVVSFSLLPVARLLAQQAPAAKPPGSLGNTPMLDAWIRIGADGGVTVFTGKAELGQGIKTALIQIAAEQLGVQPARINLVTADTSRTPDAALGLYTKLRNASHLSVQVERRGETVALDYTIR